MSRARIVIQGLDRGAPGEAYRHRRRVTNTDPFGGVGTLGDVFVATNTTLTRGLKQYRSLTIAPGVTLSQPAAAGASSTCAPIKVQRRLLILGTLSAVGTGLAGGAGGLAGSGSPGGAGVAGTGGRFSWGIGGAGGGGAGDGLAMDGGDGGDGGAQSPNYGGAAGLIGGAGGSTGSGSSGSVGGAASGTRDWLEDAIAWGMDAAFLPGMGAGGGGGGGSGDRVTPGADGSPGSPGGRGGGVIYIEADTVIIETGGVVNADGAAGTAGVNNVNGSGGGGGGAGGFILIRARLIVNRGSVRAFGGIGSTGGIGSSGRNGGSGSGAQASNDGLVIQETIPYAT